jgi:cytochrome c biogenesis protein CcmG, thiol:disulfide interchange protein DsbE
LDAVKRLLAPVPLAAILIVAALVALLAYGVAQNEPDTSIDSAVAAGERPAAPELDLPRLDGGGRTSLASLKGKVVVLNFWASWCPPCRGESPVLERWHRRLQAQNGTVLGVDVLDVDSDARAFIRRYGLTYPVIRDGDGGSRRSFDVYQQPDTIVIDRRGRIAATVRGPVTEADLRRLLPPLLREAAA